jgi:hypothetical protein
MRANEGKRLAFEWPGLHSTGVRTGSAPRTSPPGFNEEDEAEACGPSCSCSAGAAVVATIAAAAAAAGGGGGGGGGGADDAAEKHWMAGKEMDPLEARLDVRQLALEMDDVWAVTRNPHDSARGASSDAGYSYTHTHMP